MNFVTIDIETANADPVCICKIGIARTRQLFVALMSIAAVGVATGCSIVGPESAQDACFRAQDSLSECSPDAARSIFDPEFDCRTNTDSHPCVAISAVADCLEGFDYCTFAAERDEGDADLDDPEVVEFIECVMVGGNLVSDGDCCFSQ